jgi:ankyrin repeat protein
VWYNHPDELAALLEDCVGVDQRNSDGSTLLMIAAERGRIDAARVLMDHGANCALASNRGDTALGLASTPEMKALLASCRKGAALPASADASRKKQCQQKYQADAALCSDTTCKLTAQRKWGQCLKTGNYW